MGLDTFQAPYEIDSPSALSNHKEAVFDKLQGTPVSIFVEEVRTPDTSDISAFGAVNYGSCARSDDWKEIGIQSFASLVSKRCSYLEGLRNLESDWVSGGAVNPSSSAILRSQELLLYIKRKIFSEELCLIPRIVMGPIPSGGILVELHADDDNSIHVTISNDDRVELEVQYGGYYYEFNLSANELNGTVTSQYASISR